MIEAVNSVVLNAPLVRGSTDQVSASRPVSPVETQVSQSPFPQAPFISPFISVDVNFDKAVIQIRDSNTGDVLRQFPSEETLESRARAENAKLQSEALAQASNARRSSAASAAPQAQAAPEISAPARPATSASARTAPVVFSSDDAGVPDLAQAQLASAALSNGSRTASAPATTFQISA